MIERGGGGKFVPLLARRHWSALAAMIADQSPGVGSREPLGFPARRAYVASDDAVQASRFRTKIGQFGELTFPLGTPAEVVDVWSPMLPQTRKSPRRGRQVWPTPRALSIRSAIGKVCRISLANRPLHTIIHTPDEASQINIDI